MFSHLSLLHETVQRYVTSNTIPNSTDLLPETILEYATHLSENNEPQLAEEAVTLAVAMELSLDSRHLFIKHGLDPRIQQTLKKIANSTDAELKEESKESPTRKKFNKDIIHSANIELGHCSNPYIDNFNHYRKAYKFMLDNMIAIPEDAILFLELINNHANPDEQSLEQMNTIINSLITCVQNTGNVDAIAALQRHFSHSNVLQSFKFYDAIESHLTRETITHNQKMSSSRGENYIQGINAYYGRGDTRADLEKAIQIFSNIVHKNYQISDVSDLIIGILDASQQLLAVIPKQDSRVEHIVRNIETLLILTAEKILPIFFQECLSLMIKLIKQVNNPDLQLILMNGILYVCEIYQDQANTNTQAAIKHVIKQLKQSSLLANIKQLDELKNLSYAAQLGAICEQIAKFTEDRGEKYHLLRNYAHLKPTVTSQIEMARYCRSANYSEEEIIQYYTRGFNIAITLSNNGADVTPLRQMLSAIQIEDYIHKSEATQLPLINLLIFAASTVRQSELVDTLLDKLHKFNCPTISPEVKRQVNIALFHLFNADKTPTTQKQKEYLFRAVNFQNTILSDDLLTSPRFVSLYFSTQLSQHINGLFKEVKPRTPADKWQIISARNLMMLSSIAWSKDTIKASIKQLYAAFNASSIKANSDYTKGRDIYFNAENPNDLAVLQNAASYQFLPAIFKLKTHLTNQQELYLNFKCYLILQMDKKDLMQLYGINPRAVDIFKKECFTKIENSALRGEAYEALANYYLQLIQHFTTEQRQYSDWDAKLLQHVHRDRSITQTVREGIYEGVAGVYNELSFIWGMPNKEWLDKKLAVVVDEYKQEMPSGSNAINAMKSLPNVKPASEAIMPSLSGSATNVVNTVGSSLFEVKNIPASSVTNNNVPKPTSYELPKRMM